MNNEERGASGVERKVPWVEGWATMELIVEVYVCVKKGERGKGGGASGKCRKKGREKSVM